jgi:uroporphyrinogen decarboxylase
MSIDLWKKMIKPHHVKLNKKLHSYGVKILYHTCGSVTFAIDELIDMGVDILESLQFDAKDMDPFTLKSKWGGRLCFHGGISVQKTLPFGTSDDVRKEVRERISVLGKDGGYILAPAHSVQGGTPPENIVALLEEIGRFYPDQPDAPLTINTVI